MHRENNYRISKDYELDAFSYSDKTGYIGLKLTRNNFSDNELIEYISDVLTHEHIHKILHELFNDTVCCLFDGIEHLFRNCILGDKQIRYSNLFNDNSEKEESYRTYIKRKTFNDFLNYYGITQDDMIQADKICSDRVKYENMHSL